MFITHSAATPLTSLNSYRDLYLVWLDIKVIFGFAPAGTMLATNKAATFA